jgi:hypothetical protein
MPLLLTPAPSHPYYPLSSDSSRISRAIGQRQGAGGGEAGVMAALRSSLEELEAELGPHDANVLELRAILEARTANPHGFAA